MTRLCITLCALVISSTAHAHHSRANFDRNITTILTGKITDYSWRNPHVYLELETHDENGVNQTWLVESHSVTGMRRNGWDATTLAVGEEVTLSGSPDRDNAKHFILLDYVEKSDGNKLYAFGDRSEAPAEKKITPSLDFTGTWSLDMSRFNANLAGGGPPADWQYTELAQEQVDNFSVNQNPELQCNQIGVPRISIYPYGTNFYRDDDSLRIVKEHMNEKRVVWFDKNAVEFNNPIQSYVGTSYGYFKSERHLVIESSGFLPTLWGNANGVDSSADKSVVEEYVLADDGLSMELTITITDPVYFNAPVTVSAGYIKDENREFVETACDPKAASRHLSIETN